MHALRPENDQDALQVQETGSKMDLGDEANRARRQI